MDASTIRVLLIDDDEDDYVLTRDLFAEIGGNGHHLEWVREYSGALELMVRNQHDIYLLDYRLGPDNGLDLLREAAQRGCQAPIILLTGQGERDIDIEAMQAGAADFLTKGQTDALGLERAIRHALERRRDREALQQAHDKLEERVRERTAELQRLNEALRAEIADRQRAEEALKETDRRKDEFLAMLAHELRNPLAPIRNGLHVLRMPQIDAATSQRIHLILDQQVRNLVRLVDDLLDVSRITRGKIHLRKETVDLAAVVGHAVETVCSLIELEKHELSVALPPAPVYLKADPTRLEQILTNLLSNAVKYTEPGGRIWLSAARQGSEIVIRLRDNGIGIAADLLPRIFDIFTQAERRQDRAQGGLGIGLTLARRLVELHDGTISAHSEGPGRGSEFTVRLPASPTSNYRPPETPLETPKAGGKTLRILVVEDEVTGAEMLVTLLRILGHTAQAVHEGAAVLETVQTFAPDVVLCDIGLPGISGYEVAQQLRRQEGTSKLKLIATTGYGQEEDRRRAKKAGFDCHLTKPVDPRELEKLLDSLAENEIMGAM